MDVTYAVATDRELSFAPFANVRDGTLRIFPQLLAMIAADRLISPVTCPQELQTILDTLLNQALESIPCANAIELDFDHHFDPDCIPSNPVDERIRCIAYRYARCLWNLAIESAVERRLLGARSAEWTVSTDSTWRHVRPIRHSMPAQGWKLHVSATVNNAPSVLKVCLDVLLEAGISFKHAATLQVLEEICSGKCGRSIGGKFITVYPTDPQQARDVALALDHATHGMTGPAILSDRRLHEHSLVHYRYGVFTAPRRLTADGSYETGLLAPDGRNVPDQRQAWFTPPDWVSPLFPGTHYSNSKGQSNGVLLRDRYLVTGAIRHANRGGVFRGLDQSTGCRIVLKQARRGTATELTGDDAVDSLKREADNLQRTAAVSAGCIEVFECQDSLFLVQREVDGITLRDWLRQRCEDGDEATPSLQPVEMRDLLARATAILAAVHVQGLVCRDFNPNNLMIGSDGCLTLIDTELLAAPGSFVQRYYTHGFGAPELQSADKVARCPDFSADLYSLGALIYYAATGSMPPIHLPDSDLDSLATRWRLAVDRIKALGLPRIAGLVQELVSMDPQARPGLPEVLRRLNDESLWTSTTEFFRPPSPARQSPPPSFETLIDSGTQFILDCQGSAGRNRLWPSSEFGSGTDECNVQHGAAGALMYLCMISESEQHPRLRPAIADAASWIDLRLSQRDTLLPGLYFGAGGAAWACLSAGRLLSDRSMIDRAIEHLLRLPVTWPNPDVCHGLAGAGLAFCRAWLDSGDPRLLQRIHDVSDELLRTRLWTGKGVYWQVDPDCASTLKGVRHYGFAHGIAGIACFLLVAGLIVDRSDCIEAAEASGHHLVAAAQTGPFGARWSSSVDAPVDSAKDMLYHWCSGSSGVGSFLLRLWRVTGRPKFRQLAEAAAHAVHWVRWHSGPSGCHGLAGNGEFLLDMAQWLDPGYRDRARDLAHCLRLKTTTKNGLHLIVDESEIAVTVDFNTGLSGALAFLHRLSVPVPRLWMVDDLLMPSASGVR